MESTDIFVAFEKYCPLCKYNKYEEKFDPCNECLDYGVNKDSEKPLFFKAAEDE